MSRLYQTLTLALGVSAATLAVGASGARAQDRFAGYTETAPVPDQNDRDLRTFFTVGDVRGVVNAPLQGPGNGNIAYHTFEGQSMTGGDSVVAQRGRNPLVDQ